MKDYYDTLGVSPYSETEVITAAYKALMRKYHPDHNSSDPGGVRAREINEAFAVLRDPAKRREFDRKRQIARAEEPLPRQREHPDNAPIRWPAWMWMCTALAFIALCTLIYLERGGDNVQAATVLPFPSRKAEPVITAPADRISSELDARISPVGFKTSFDCTMAALRVEQQICRSAALAARDLELALLYDDLKDRLRWNQRTALRESQEDWLSTRNLCWTESCIGDTYDERISLLRAIKSPGPAYDHSPSFNCDLARTWAEEQVCQDAGLAAKDREMSHLHDQLRDALPGAEFLLLRDSQTSWIRTRDSCVTLSCISKAYDERVAALSSWGQ